MEFKHIPKDLLESLSLAVFAIDDEGKFTFVNKTAEIFLKKNQDELIGKLVWEEYAEWASSQPFKEVHRAVKAKAQVDFECLSQLLNKWIQVKGMPLENGYCVSFYLIDMKKRLEDELRESLKKKG